MSYRYVFETPFGRLHSEATETLNIREVTAHEDLGRYLHSVEQYVGGYMGLSGLTGGSWVTL